MGIFDVLAPEQSVKQCIRAGKVICVEPLVINVGGLQINKNNISYVFSGFTRRAREGDVVAVAASGGRYVILERLVKP